MRQFCANTLLLTAFTPPKELLLMMHAFNVSCVEELPLPYTVTACVAFFMMAELSSLPVLVLEKTIPCQLPGKNLYGSSRRSFVNTTSDPVVFSPFTLSVPLIITDASW